MLAIIPLTCASALSPQPFGRREAVAAGLLASYHPPRAAFASDSAEAAYQRDPADISGAVLPDFSQRDVFLHFHGRGGPDREDTDLRERVLASDRQAGLDRFVHVFEWRQWLEAASTERISYVGQAIGAKQGRALASHANLRSLHVVGTSAGAFAANECVSAYVAAAAGKPRATVRLTLCDPFTARADEVSGDASMTTGSRIFGRDADFAEHYLNTDDIVPSTSTPLPLCYCYDVTKSAERVDFPPPDTGNALQDLGLKLLGAHNWPIYYFAHHYETKVAGGQPVLPSHDELPRGGVLRVA